MQRAITASSVLLLLQSSANEMMVSLNRLLINLPLQKKLKYHSFNWTICKLQWTNERIFIFIFSYLLFISNDLFLLISRSFLNLIIFSYIWFILEFFSLLLLLFLICYWKDWNVSFIQLNDMQMSMNETPAGKYLPAWIIASAWLAPNQQ